MTYSPHMQKIWICLIAFVLSTVLSSCSQWPIAATGGQAERDAGDDYFASAADHAITGSSLASLLEIQQAQLDVMVLQGALYCIPASVQLLQRLSSRIRREIAGKLYIDARHDLVVLQKNLRSAREQFWYVANQTDCEKTFDHDPLTAQPIQHRSLHSVYFDRAENGLSPRSKRQLDWFATQCPNQSVISIAGFADSQGNEQQNLVLSEQRANAVKAYLQQKGISDDQMTITFHGEQTPLLNAQRGFAMGMNRRVDVYFVCNTNDEFANTHSEPLAVKNWWSVLTVDEPTFAED